MKAKSPPLINPRSTLLGISLHPSTQTLSLRSRQCIPFPILLYRPFFNWEMNEQTLFHLQAPEFASRADFTALRSYRHLRSITCRSHVLYSVHILVCEIVVYFEINVLASFITAIFHYAPEFFITQYRAPLFSPICPPPTMDLHRNPDRHGHTSMVFVKSQPSPYINPTHW